MIRYNRVVVIKRYCRYCLAWAYLWGPFLCRLGDGNVIIRAMHGVVEADASSWRSVGPSKDAVETRPDLPVGDGDGILATSTHVFTWSSKEISDIGDFLMAESVTKNCFLCALERFWRKCFSFNHVFDVYPEIWGNDPI